MQATMSPYLRARYRATFPDEFVDVNLSVNQESSSGVETRQRREERQLQDKVFVFTFTGFVTFRSGLNGFPTRSNVISIQAVALSDTGAISGIMRQNDNIPPDAVLESVTIIPTTDSPFFGPVEPPSLAPGMPNEPTDGVGATSESSPSTGPSFYPSVYSDPGEFSPSTGLSYVPSSSFFYEPDPARQLVSSSLTTKTSLGPVIPLERFSVSVLALERPGKDAMLETMTTHLTEEFIAEYPKHFVRVDLHVDGGTKTSTTTTTITRPRRQRLHARQDARKSFVFTFHGTVTFQQEAAANIPFFHGHVTTIQAVALSDPHAIQFAIKSNPNILGTVLVDSVQMITSSAFTMPHGTSTTQDTGTAKESL